jgi:hypothetical protein
MIYKNCCKNISLVQNVILQRSVKDNITSRTASRYEKLQVNFDKKVIKSK